MRKNTRVIIFISGVLLLAFGMLGLKEDDKRFQISKGLDIFATLFRDVNLFYVDDVQPEKMVQDGIDAMLKKLDPYTVYYPETKLDEFKMMTTGEYAGIGSVIGMKDDYVVIREPYKGSPSYKAGLLPGDLILAVDGENMKGKNVEYVSSRLKGQPGKEVVLKLQRVGEEKPLEKRVLREVVQVPSVPYYGMLNNEIGYIYFTGFTDKAADDVRSAIMDLKNRGAQSLVLDLRGNGGGLLDQAVEIANFFLPKGSLIVSTKGKMKQWDKEYRTTRNPLLPDMKLAVLIDRASASASEILSGSLQDYDRAVVMIVGFGKFIPFIWNTRIEDRLNAIVDQPLYMSVCQLRRITLGFTRDGINSQFVYLAVGYRRKDNPESQFIKECEPERIILVHVQYTRDTNESARSIFLCQWFIIKISF